ncbi:endonuclease/exonuclease/phosphatase family protein [Breznakia blatticola]|uniref:endonuclease/exonuclease/phosphatase family protein n=1 Tax=Breznakia blatticola TaxID=1754012 RepID=UPI0014170691|nr:endonuclease/exonuclease/phosphatase family protein [Breznakia blatticola]
MLLVVACALFLVWRFESRSYRKAFDIDTSVHTPDTLRVASYNIKLLDEGKGLSNITEELKDMDIDILCLQEVDQNALRSGNFDQVEAIANALDFPYYHFYKTMFVFPGHYGLAILSKYPIKEVISREIPQEIFTEPRILAEAIIQLDDKEIHVYNTHFTWNQQRVQMKEVNFVHDNLAKENIILMGDFNSFWNEKQEQYLGLQQLNNEENRLITFMGFASPDNIFIDDAFEVISMQMQATTFSDHAMVYADLKVK